VALNLQVDTEETTETTKLTANSPLCVNGLHQIMDITAYSSLTKLLHISAYVLCFIFNSKQPNTSHRRTGPLLPEELTEALQAWIHGCQQTVFVDDSSMQVSTVQLQH